MVFREQRCSAVLGVSPMSDCIKTGAGSREQGRAKREEGRAKREEVKTKRISEKFFYTDCCPPSPPSEGLLAWGEQDSICF
ncbi:hypothetical protein BJP34_34935 [Moorena producens PAL-8-15-08-1]|uniref:Uncharacterized protein n=1 Tax=Moorena producens PAL-8-15-08-1 TaxID=1458985 RepID=A0A1D8U2C1_9CYAN|nr:hypothetical protein BJP34_34935 [Moorena producens PAL-8-15-08-1]